MKKRLTRVDVLVWTVGLAILAAILWGLYTLKAMAYRHAARGEATAFDAMFLP